MYIEKLISGAALPQNPKKTTDTADVSAFSDVLGSLLGSPGADLESLFSEASKRYGVSLDLLKAVAKTESNYNPLATSGCGAMGVMQLMPETAAGLGVADAYDPEQNIMGGAKLLSQLLSRYDGQTELALAAYNAGAGNVEKYGGIPPFEETQKYVNIIMNLLNGAAGYSIPENYNNYSQYLNTHRASGGTVQRSASDESAAQTEGTQGYDPMYLVSLLQLNMQMGLFGDDDEENKII